MCKERQQQTSIISAAKDICKATKVHSIGKAWIASLLKTIMPTEQTIQLLTPNTVSEVALILSTSSLALSTAIDGEKRREGSDGWLCPS
mmetsp:Transcript_76834/g.156118  ORF Transcript_76834/g.156118 Transcript_76834/m.156118 type:complete len:89 (-) Transcript_76834:9-275(-)